MSRLSMPRRAAEGKAPLEKIYGIVDDMMSRERILNPPSLETIRDEMAQKAIDYVANPPVSMDTLDTRVTVLEEEVF